MATTLLGQSTKTFSGMALTKYVNNEKGTHYDNIAEAVVGLSVSVVATAIFPPMAAAIATGLGISIALSVVIDAIEEALDDDDLESIVGRMKEGDSLRVTTKFYEWSSGSGNSYTYYSTESYKIV